MIYLDYAANTPPEKEILDLFVEVNMKYIANPNSNHCLGKEIKNEIDLTSTQIANYFNAKKESVIYTSGATESNNLVIKGIADRYKDVGKHIIVSAIEHSSIIAPCNYLAEKGYSIDIIPLNKNGTVDIKELKNKLTNETILVSICTVDSEVGLIQPISEIATIVKTFPNCFFHTDATQAIGKIQTDFKNVDFVTFTPHKFFGLNGSGILLNLNQNKFSPLIHGGKSTTIFRSGTPAVANIKTTGLALNKAIDNLEERIQYNIQLKKYIIQELAKIKNIHINTNNNTIPNIVNFSVLNKTANDLKNYLEDLQIIVSTQSACSLDNAPSKSVLAITNDIILATNSIRMSFCHLTTMEEIKKVILAIKIFMEK